MFQKPAQPAAKRPCCRLLSQSVELGADDRVALTRRLFQPLAVPHSDAPMRVADESRPLQRGGDRTDGRTLDTEHDRQELVAQGKVLLLHPVVRLSGASEHTAAARDALRCTPSFASSVR